MQTHNYAAPYRGPTNSYQYNIFQLEVISDISNIYEKINNFGNPADIQDEDSNIIEIYKDGVLDYSSNKKSIDTIITDLARMRFLSNYNSIGGL